MEIPVTNASGQSSDATLDVSDAAFGLEFNEPLVHQVVVAYMATGRSGTKAQKTRSEVSGGGAKPWRQKGTGRARAGSSRSPLWRGGGATFAAQPRKHDQKINRKMYRKAIRTIISQLFREDRVIVVDDFSVSVPKTKELVAQLKALGVEQALIVLEQFDERVLLAARNLAGVSVIHAGALDPVSLVAAGKVIMTTAAVKRIEEALT